MKIALSENKININGTMFDKVIGFYPSRYDSIDSYISAQEYYRNQEDVHGALYSWAESQAKRKNFVYRDVDILRSYEEKIFHFLSYLYQKIYAIKKMTTAENPSELWISRQSVNYAVKNYPLSYFIADYLPAGVTLNYFEPQNGQKEDYLYDKSKKKNFLKIPLSLIINLCAIMDQKLRENILIFSDFTPILKILEALKKENIIFVRKDLPETLILPLLIRGINPKLFSDSKISDNERKEINEAVKYLRGNLNTLTEAIDIGHINVLTYVKKYIMAIWENELQEVLENVLRMHRLFKTYKIKSLLVDEDRTIYKNLLVQVSGLYQCKSYVNCHGEPYAKIGSIPLAADYIFVWGKSQKTLLANWGISNDRILISGNTKYEKYLYTPALKIKKKICQEQRLLSIKPLLLIIPYHIHEKSYVWENSLWLENKKNIETVSMFSETNVIVKLHPGDTYETETKLFTENLPNKLIRVLKYYDPLLLAKGADLLIVSQSTFCIDGLAYQKPVILVDQYSFERYKSLNFFYDGTTQEKLNDALQGILTGRYQKHIENWKTAADYILDGMDGKASGKIARILTQQQ